MKMLGWIAAAAIVTAPLLIAGAASAETADQYRAQGRGSYLTSMGNPTGWSQSYGYRPDYGYGQDYGYGPVYGYPQPYGQPYGAWDDSD